MSGDSVEWFKETWGAIVRGDPALMKTHRNSGATAELMGQLFVAHYWLPLPGGEGWGEGRRTPKAGLSFARLFANRVALAATSGC